MTEQTAEFIFGSWSAPGVSVAIEYPLEVMDEIRAAAADGLQKLARGGLEVAGVLFGVEREAGIRILTWRPILCEYALGPTLQLSERDRAALTRLLETAEADFDLQGLKPVGWFLSHTRSDILLSPSDLEIFNTFFPQPWQVTLVLRPTQSGPARAGFFVREIDGALKSDSSYQEFDVQPLRRAARPPDPPPPVTPEPSTPSSRRNIEAPLAPPMTGAVEGRAVHADPPLFRTLERPRTRPGWLWMLPVILGLIVAGLFVKERYLAPQNQPFSLHVSEAGERVQIEWDRNAAPIRNSHIGVIDIRDGGETKRYSLADEELRAGKISYLRGGGDLELRMTVYPVGSTAMQEFVHFLDPGPSAAPPNPPPAPASTSEIDQLRLERDRLDTQVKQLKEDLRKERSRRGRFR